MGGSALRRMQQASQEFKATEEAAPVEEEVSQLAEIAAAADQDTVELVADAWPTDTEEPAVVAATVQQQESAKPLSVTIAVSSHGEEYEQNGFELSLTDADYEAALDAVTPFLSITEEEWQGVSLADKIDLQEGEARQYSFGQGGEGPHSGKALFVADVTSPMGQEEWSGSYARSVVQTLGKRFGSLFVSLNEGVKKTLLIGGKAREVGLAREVFADTMSMVGLKVGWRGFEPEADPNQNELQRRLKKHGVTVGMGLSSPDINPFDVYVYSAIEKVDKKHRASLIKVTLANMAAELGTLTKVVESVRNDYRKKPGYENVREVLEKYDISEESLYYILKDTPTGEIIDQDKTIFGFLDKYKKLLEPAEHAGQSYLEAIKTVITEAKRLKDPAPSEISAIFERAGLDPKELGIALPLGGAQPEPAQKVYNIDNARKSSPAPS